jgi:hypothetical protein
LKKFQIGSSLLLAVVGGLLVSNSTAQAATLYSNGALNGSLNDWFIDAGDGSAVTNSFTLGSASTLTAVDFVVWVNTGDTPDTIDWAITSSDFGTVLPGASAAAAPLSSTLQFTNDSAFGSYDVYDVSFSIPSVSLAAGTYWLQLQNGATANLDLMGWDENDGPSAAFSATVIPGGGPPPYADITSTINTVCSFYDNCTDTPQTGSETFQIEGTPEPGTVFTLLSGLLMVGGAAFYRNRRKTVC